jgi:hypothetical protein
MTLFVAALPIAAFGSLVLIMAASGLSYFAVDGVKGRERRRRKKI